MLTRLKANGFKNLQDVDVRLGPFTCIAGPNGVGKSNFFDAIAFLAALADKSLMDAALSVRGGEGITGDIRNLFRRSGSKVNDRMSFEVEMIIPATGEDLLGEQVEASTTYLTYRLELRHRSPATARPLGGIEIVSESLGHLDHGEARKNLGFDHSDPWRDSVIQGHPTSAFISTATEAGGSVVSLHPETGGQPRRPRKVPAHGLRRTMLSSVNDGAEHPTLVTARQEMMSWTQLHLEPTALRAPDAFSAPPFIGTSGAHVPATLHRVAECAARETPGVDVYSQIANRLAELDEDVRAIAVDVDEKRQLLSIVMTDRQETPYPASSLSDGALRFLALAVMEADSSPRSLLCLEEPENSMHPRRIPAVLRLLHDLAVDPHEPVSADNPLRQVIVSTHSPRLVAEVPDDSLLVAEPPTHRSAGESRLRFAPLPGTWRTHLDPTLQPVALGVLQDYLSSLGHPLARLG